MLLVYSHRSLPPAVHPGGLLPGWGQGEVGWLYITVLPSGLRACVEGATSGPQHLSAGFKSSSVFSLCTVTADVCSQTWS